VCACSLLSVVLHTRIGVVLLSPFAWVQCISCGYSLKYVLCSVHCPLDLDYVNLSTVSDAQCLYL